MDPLLDQLCDSFDDALERQKDLLAVCCALGTAARVHDVESLEAKSEALNLLVEEGANAERARFPIILEVVERYGLPVEQQSLSALIRTVPEPWARRLIEFQSFMRTTIEKTQQVVAENNQSIRRSLGVVHQTLDTLSACVQGQPCNYNAQGAAASRTSMASLVDRQA